jgi:hypothetical protein
MTLHLKKCAIFLFLISSQTAFAFGQDVCFYNTDPNQPKKNLLTNCIDVDAQCKTDQLSVKETQACKKQATSSAMESMFNPDILAGGRSLMHMDFTYYMAQLIGYPAKAAYQIAIYDEATDSGQYIPFDAQGKPLLTAAERQSCDKDSFSNKKCLLMSASINGVAKFNSTTGGMLLHLGARFADKPTPPLTYPTKYTLTPNLDPHLASLRTWALGASPNACVVGITQSNGQCIQGTATNPAVLTGYVPACAPGKSALIAINTLLGEQIINSDLDKNNIPLPTHVIYSHDIDNYVKPHDGAYAKLGIYLHALQDRYSHHNCSDYSYMYATSADSNHYNVLFDNKECDQGNHMYWHSLEAGTHQQNIENQMHHTLEPAMSATFDELVAYAKTHNININPDLEKEKWIKEYVAVIGIYDASERLQAVMRLFQAHHLVPLPGQISSHSSTPINKQ